MTRASGKPHTTLEQIKAEIDRLSESQGTALKAAANVGMTPDEAKEVDERRTVITQLMQRMFLLKQKEQ